jgi:3-oxoacyl-[acyl-carrier protein] reductase
MTATAVVTGAATGIGSATADALADAGYAVALWDIDEAAVQAGAAEIAARGRTAIAARVDVSNADSIHAALAAVRRELSTPTAVVSAAGMMAAPVPRSPAREMGCDPAGQPDWHVSSVAGV